MVKMFIINY